MLVCEDDRVLRLATAQLPDHVRQVAQVGVLKSRFSRTENRTYTSNGCFHCDALIGNFFLYSEELPTAIKRHGRSGLTVVTESDISYRAVLSFLNRSNTWAGAVPKGQVVHRPHVDHLTRSATSRPAYCELRCRSRK